MGDWKTYAVFCNESDSKADCKLATRKIFVGKAAALQYAKDNLAYLVNSGGWFAIIPVSEIKEALRPMARDEEYWR